MTALDFYKERLKKRGFSDKQIKELTDHKDLPWLQFAEEYHTRQLILFGVIESNGVDENEPRILGLLTEEQINRGVNHCSLCKYKKFGNGGKDCTECVNNGQPHQYFL